MAQFKNVAGRRYYKTLYSVGKQLALDRARQHRARGLLSRIASDGHGHYDVLTASAKLQQRARR